MFLIPTTSVLDYRFRRDDRIRMKQEQQAFFR